MKETPDIQAGASDATHQGLPPGRRILAMLAVQAAVAMTVIDTAIANIALPVIGRDLHAAASASIWVVNAYQIALTVLLLPMARLGEVIGYRRQYLIGLVIFIISSLGCALSGSLLTLTLWRVVQGVGAATVLCVNSALIRHSFPAHMLGRVLGFGSLTVGGFYALGPGLAAAILSVGSWHWLFGVNLPFGLCTLALAWRALPPDLHRGGHFDRAGAALSVVALGLFLLAVESLSHGWGVRLIAAALAATIAVGLALLRRERDASSPIVPVDLLRLATFRLSMMAAVLAFIAQMLAYTALPFMLERQLGLNQVQIGVALMAWPAALALTAPLAGWLADHYPPARLGGIGLALYATGLALLLVMPADIGLPGVMLRLACCGAGLGLFQSPNGRLAILATPLRRSGAAGGFSTATRLFGQTIGSALVAFAFRVSDEQGSAYALAGGIGAAVIAMTVSFARKAELMPSGRQGQPVE